MKNILDHYEINSSTMALISAANIAYSTIVLKENQQLFVRQRPTEIVVGSILL